MTEWTIVIVVSTLLALVLAIINPIVKVLKAGMNLNIAMAENTIVIKTLTDAIKNNESRNEKDRCEIWEELTDHGNRLADHDHRIVSIESIK